MKHIPTLREARRNYEAIAKAGGMVDALPAVEQLILKFCPICLFEYWTFRRRLRRVLSEAMQTPPNETKAAEFINKYSQPLSRKQLTALLIRAIKEIRESDE